MLASFTSFVRICEQKSRVLSFVANSPEYLRCAEDKQEEKFMPVILMKQLL